MIEKAALQRRSYWVIGLFLVVIASSVLGVLLDLFVMAAQPLNATSRTLVVGVVVVNLGTTLGTLATAIAFCFWIYRANANLHAAEVPRATNMLKAVSSCKVT